MHFCFSNLGMVQQKMNKHAEAVESYSYALNFAPIIAVNSA